MGCNLSQWVSHWKMWTAHPEDALELWQFFNVSSCSIIISNILTVQYLWLNSWNFNNNPTQLYCALCLRLISEYLHSNRLMVDMVNPYLTSELSLWSSWHADLSIYHSAQLYPIAPYSLCCTLKRAHSLRILHTDDFWSVPKIREGTGKGSLGW